MERAMSDGDGPLLPTPLDSEHRALGAHMGAFAGWSMPIEYRGTLAEHRAVREAVGIFDLTHLGKIALEGSGAEEALQRAMPNDVSRVEVGGAQYNMVLNERGGIVDDLINYRVADDRWLCVPNAANVHAVHEALLAQAAGGIDVAILDDLCLIAPQGSKSFDLVGQVFTDAVELEYMHCAEMSYRGESMVVSRSGYTGERGFELFVPAALATDLWRELLKLGDPLGLEPCGLGARDTLRLEMGYPLHGNDISPERTPLEAGLTWAVAMDKGVDFVGREALAKQKSDGIPSRLRGFRMRDRLIPRPHYPVFAGDEQVGETTSGTFSPTLKVGIGMGYVSPRDRVALGDEVEIDVRGRRGTAEVVKPPFVDRTPR
jgi:glycine cleavage system T protein (aminomethyltransferase)